MKKIRISLLLLPAIYAGAEETKTPEAFVGVIKQIYDETYSEEGYVTLEKYLEPKFASLFTKLQGFEYGDMECIGYNYIIQGQDYDEKSREITRSLQVKVLDKESIEARFKNFGKEALLIYKINCQGGKCLITDFIEKNPENNKPVSFRQSLQECIGDLEKNQPAK